MKHRRSAAALALLLCMMTLLSGTLLILHSEQHSCHITSCPTCVILETSAETFLNAFIFTSGFRLLQSLSFLLHAGAMEDRFVPDWTLVRRKVKLLN